MNTLLWDETTAVVFPHTTSVLGFQQYKDLLSGKPEKVGKLGAADLWENVLRPVSVCK